MSAGLLKRIKERAKERGIPYQRYMREVLERSL
jgi:predicted DNA binding CopG/RHH family protein